MGINVKVETNDAYYECIDYISVLLNDVKNGEVTLSKTDVEEDEFLGEMINKFEELNEKLNVTQLQLCHFDIEQ